MWILLDMLIAVYAYPSWQWYIVLQNGSSPRSTEFLPIIWRWVEEIAIVVMRTSDERISTQRNTRCTWTKSVIWILMQSLRSLLQEKYKFLPAKYRRYPFKFFMSVCTNTCRVCWYVYVLLWVSMVRQCVCAGLPLTFSYEWNVLNLRRDFFVMWYTPIIQVSVSQRLLHDHLTTNMLNK